MYMSKKIIGDVMLKRLYLRKLPEILRDLIIDGKFSCSDNNLLSLENSPLKVTDAFYCNYNKLITLKGCTQFVGGFACNETNITSLEGCPKYVGGDFFCRNNGVQFSEKQIRAVCDVKGSIFSVDVLYNRDW